MNETEVPYPNVQVPAKRRPEFRSICNRLEDLSSGSLIRPTLRQANRLLLAYFLVLDILNDEDQMALKRSALGARMQQHCDAVFCALSYEYNSQDGDVGETWILLWKDVSKLLARLTTRPQTD
jgi:hypothetical protein